MQAERLRSELLAILDGGGRFDLGDSGHQQAGRLRSQLLAVSDVSGRFELGDFGHQQAGRLRSQLLAISDVGRRLKLSDSKKILQPGRPALPGRGDHHREDGSRFRLDFNYKF